MAREAPKPAPVEAPHQIRGDHGVPEHPLVGGAGGGKSRTHQGGAKDAGQTDIQHHRLFQLGPASRRAQGAEAQLLQKPGREDAQGRAHGDRISPQKEGTQEHQNESQTQEQEPSAIMGQPLLFSFFHQKITPFRSGRIKTGGRSAVWRPGPPSGTIGTVFPSQIRRVGLFPAPALERAERPLRPEVHTPARLGQGARKIHSSYYFNKALFCFFILLDYNSIGFSVKPPGVAGHGSVRFFLPYIPPWGLRASPPRRIMRLYHRGYSLETEKKKPWKHLPGK